MGFPWWTQRISCKKYPAFRSSRCIVEPIHKDLIWRVCHHFAPKVPLLARDSRLANAVLARRFAQSFRVSPKLPEFDHHAIRWANGWPEFSLPSYRSWQWVYLGSGHKKQLFPLLCKYPRQAYRQDYKLYGPYCGWRVRRYWLALLGAEQNDQWFGLWRFWPKLLLLGKRKET